MSATACPSSPADLRCASLRVAEVLDEGGLRRIAGSLGLRAEQVEALVAELPLMRGPETAAHLAGLHERMFVRREPLADEVGSWPTPDQPAGAHLPHLFYAFWLLSGVPAVRAWHAARGIPEEVTRATLADLGPWLDDYRRHVGRFGLRQLSWLHHHYAGRLYSLGRLQFLFEDFEHPFRWYRHRAEPGRVVLLSEEARAVDRDGRELPPEAGAAPCAPLGETETAVEGHPLSAEGRIAERPVRLEKADWRLVLRPGEPALSVHITATGPLRPEDCRDSYARAADFFPRHFPEKPIHAYLCFSWLLDPSLAGYLDAGSNIVRFQRQFQRFPLRGADDAQFRGLFPEAWTSPAACAPRTSLQAALLAHLRAGRRWSMFGGIVEPLVGGLASPL